MPALDFEGRSIPVRDGDTVASALFRAGVRTFSRSFKFHRPRGLYCCTGDCPNCLVTVNDEPAVRACVHEAADGQRVTRGSGWPSADHDALHVMWWMRALLPVGFYYKLFAKPLWTWPVAERVIRKIAGIGPVPRGLPQDARERLYHHPDVLVIGGGPAGLSAAITAAEDGASVLLADEGRIGAAIASGPVRSEVDSLRAAAQANERITILQHAAAIGIYDGALTPITAPDCLHIASPGRVIVATGAVELHAVFPGSDLPGVWLGRGAARMAGV
ncbi:MAG TPA: 2Fe-2S iron-sulfur cluster-binding protein, partial [Vicinamibacterales bacterium]|nr:2Fe-2S iron-sulfur cluster-binding protein [Vicinamibacterales bacterium]